MAATFGLLIFSPVKPEMQDRGWKIVKLSQEQMQHAINALTYSPPSGIATSALVLSPAAKI